jgi:hypothetical protein
MQPDPVAKAVELAQTILTATHSHPFEKALEEFVQVLGSIPDHPASAFADDTITTLNDLAEQVIAQIEERVGRAEDSSPVQQQLVEGIYDIRRVLEDIYRWRQHRQP